MKQSESMEKTVKMNVTIPGCLLATVKDKAKEEKRSLSNMVSVLIEKGLKEKAA